MKAVSLWAARVLLFPFIAGAAFGGENEIPWYKIAAGVTGVLHGSPGASGDGIDGTFNPSMSFDVEFTLRTSKSGTAYTLF